MEYLVCKECGYKQEDTETIAVYKEQYGEDVVTHDIEYICGACQDK